MPRPVVWLLPKPSSVRTEPGNAIEEERRHVQDHHCRPNRTLCQGLGHGPARDPDSRLATVLGQLDDQAMALALAGYRAAQGYENFDARKDGWTKVILKPGH